MTRTVNGERLFGNREKEVLRKMIRQVEDFSGVQVLTYCIMSNHFHVLVRVSGVSELADAELLRRYKVLYPKPTKYQQASIKRLEKDLAAGGEEADTIRDQLLVRMGDISEFMKTLKQRFSIWFNKSHRRFGTLWADRFKSVLVEGGGNPLQTMAAYIELNPVRARLVDDPKDYRFCGYAEAVSGEKVAIDGLCSIWSDYDSNPLRAHRLLIFGQGSEGRGPVIDREKALKVLEKEDGVLPKAAVLRCRVRYFTDGVILGSSDFVRGFTDAVERDRRRKRPREANPMRGADWGDLAVLQSLRREVFS